MRTSHTITRSALAAPAFIAAAVALSASPATVFADGASTVTADYDSSRDPASVGFDDAFGPGSGVGAAISSMQVEGGDTIRVFCVEFGVDLGEGVEYQSAPWTDLRSGNPSRIGAARWLAANLTYDAAGNPTGNPVGTPISTDDGFPEELLPNAEASAAQLAVWNVVNGVDISQTANARILQRAEELATLMLQQSGSVPGPYNFSVVATVDGSVEDSTLTVGTFQDDLLTPIGDVLVTVTSPDVDLDPSTDGVQTSVEVTTGEDGMAMVEGLTGVGESSEVSVEASFILPRGTLLSTSDGGAHQQVVTVDRAAVARSAVAAVNVIQVLETTTVPAESTSTVPQAAATTLPPSQPDRLADTGPTVTWALIALGVGSATVFFVSRRRIA